MEVQARLKTRIPVTDVGTTIPLRQYTITRDCCFDSFSPSEMYGTAEFDLVDH